MNARPEVLVVDDDGPLAGLVRDVFETHGFKVTVASDALQGVLEARRRHPALVLLDWYMPGGHGGDVLYRLRGDPSTAGIPVIFFTCAPEAKVRAAIGGQFRIGFLPKPSSVGALLTAVGAMLGGLGPALAGGAA